MKRKMLLGLGLCFLLAGCSGSKAPELLAPVGETADSAKVTRGEMYNIAAYNSAVTSEYKEVRLPSDAIVKHVNVQIGDSISAGSPILTLDNEGAGEQVTDVDAKIAELEASNAYLNQIEEYDIQLLEYELQMIRENGNNVYDIQKKSGEIAERRSRLETTRIEQQKEIAELQLSKTEGSLVNGEVLSPWDGTIVYLNTGTNGSILESGTIVAIVAKKDSKILFGDYVETEVAQNAHRIYAKIGDKEYNVTHVPYDQMVMSRRVFLEQPLYSTFYLEDSSSVSLGMYASIVVITDYKENALQIPENALLSDKEGYYVYKKKGKEYERQNVSVGHMTETAVEITKGLEEGDEVYVKS
ncbi:MAG: efflux RND transporter periplasmic adaptor subunit [Lachnospiraceae bacterium]|nr:efflux RND transporter periplasmic adaptor subunit [Lachnospiraceae bacterium]